MDVGVGRNEGGMSILDDRFLLQPERTSQLLAPNMQLSGHSVRLDFEMIGHGHHC
jgi:hypothetical protein